MSLDRLRATLRYGKGVVSPLPLAGRRDRLSCVPFFVVGSVRSGNTLLRRILMQDDTVCIPPESYTLGPMARRFRSYYRFLPWPFAVRLAISELESTLGFEYWDINLAEFYQIALTTPEEQRSLATLIDRLYVYYSAAKKPAATRWGDKTPRNVFHLPLLHRVFPSAKFIHMVRDGRDVVASSVKAGIYPLQQACVVWQESMDLAQAFGRRVGEDSYLEVGYEELVRQPHAVTQRVCSFLRIDYRDALLEPAADVGELGDSVLPHHECLVDKISDRSIGRWRGQLSVSDRSYVLNALGPLLARQGYRLDGV